METTQSETKKARSPGRRVPERTCVGCGKLDSATNLVRTVLGPSGQIAVDLAGHSAGRGAHIHPLRACIERAANRGFSKAFRSKVVCDPNELTTMLLDAAARRTAGLLSSAVRSHAVAIGRESIEQALRREGKLLVVVACDAGSSAKTRSIREAIAGGSAVAWGTKAELGALVGRQELALLGVRNPLLAGAIVGVCHLADSVRSGSEVR